MSLSSFHLSRTEAIAPSELPCPAEKTLRDRFGAGDTQSGVARNRL
jgi:hypothetical protein